MNSEYILDCFPEVNEILAKRLTIFVNCQLIPCYTVHC